MSALLARIEKTTPFGVDILNDVIEKCRLCFDDAQITSSGYADTRMHLIALNPHENDDELITTLLHEARHITQHQTCDAFPRRGQLTVSSQLMLDRAMEADADACACVAAMEMAKNGDNKALLAFGKKRPDVLKAAVSAQTDNVDTAALLNAAFCGWYDNDGLKTVYENNYIVKPMKLAMTYRKETKLTYDKPLSSRDIAKNVCRDGYFKNADMLEHGKFADINLLTYLTMRHFFKVRQLRTGMPADKTFSKLKLRERVFFDKKNSPFFAKEAIKRAAFKGR